MKHRVLSLLFLLISLTFCSSGETAPAESTDEQIIWAYSGEAGPENWGKLSAEFLVCDQGVRQSPVDLRASPAQATLDPVLTWTPGRPHLMNNGRTIEVSLAQAQRLALDSIEYSLDQFHFHSPSEHTIEGREFPLEIHFVFRAGSRIAVAAVLVEEGNESAAIASIESDLPANRGEQGHLGIEFDAELLIPAGGSRYRYAGSLTTPPCSEGVQWIVFGQPLTLSGPQLQSFSSILRGNRRPLQSLEGRSVVLDLQDRD